MKSVLSIAGSDSSGGAGIQADLRTAATFKVYACTAITAVTAQNPRGIKSAVYVGDDLLRDQLDAILESIRPDAVKIGMLACPQAAEIVADAIKRYNLNNVVLDPVFASTSGYSLSGSGTDDKLALREAMLQMLLPSVTLLTPNIPELLFLASANSEWHSQEPDEESIACAVDTLLSNYDIRGLLVKGGHNALHPCLDILYNKEETNGSLHISVKEYPGKQIYTNHTHGTGCTLSTAIACMLAQGDSLAESVKKAKDFVTDSIKAGKTASLFDANGPIIQF